MIKTIDGSRWQHPLVLPHVSRRGWPTWAPCNGGGHKMCGPLVGKTTGGPHFFSHRAIDSSVHYPVHFHLNFPMDFPVDSSVHYAVHFLLDFPVDSFVQYPVHFLLDFPVHFPVLFKYLPNRLYILEIKNRCHNLYNKSFIRRFL